MGWIPDGRRLRRVREGQDYTIELLAEAAGVGEKTIRNLESGRTKRARLSTLKALAAVLDIEVTDLGWPEDDGPGPGAIATRPPVEPGSPTPERGPTPERAAARPPGARSAAPGLPPPSRLEELVEKELRGALPLPELPLLTTGRGPVQMLTPKRFQDIMTAFVLHEGTRLWYPGVVLRQRGISEAEARVLSTECGVGARFLLSQRAELSGGEPFHVTAYTAQGAHTRALQESLESRREITLVLRVAVARPDPAPAAGAPAAGTPAAGTPAEPRRFQGFAMYGSQTPHPWTLVVEEVLDR